MDKLSEIMAHKRREIADRMRDVSTAELEALAATSDLRPSFAKALRTPNRLAVIAEMKRRSPSAGAISEATSAVDQASRYAAAGADAISVLTDREYFGGSLGDLESITSDFRSRDLSVPCLRKDFMLHPIQVIEAVHAGASAILIIVRALTDVEMAALFTAANLTRLDAIFEVHSEPEIERAAEAGALIMGVNNRDLARFETDLAISERLIPLIPDGAIAISESGISTIADAARARAAGAHAILVGEALMRADDPGALLAGLQNA